MNKSDLFSYLSAFVTIVLAVAITDMIQSTHRLIRGRQRIKWDVTHLIFAAIVAAAIVSEFFSLWGLFEVSKISFARLMWILLIPTLFALLAYSVLPDDVPADGLDLREFYVAERKSWIIIYTAATLLDVVRSVDVINDLATRFHHPEWVTEYLVHTAKHLPVTLIGLGIMWSGRSRRWDLIGVLLVAAAAILVSRPGPSARSRAGSRRSPLTSVFHTSRKFAMFHPHKARE